MNALDSLALMSPSRLCSLLLIALLAPFARAEAQNTVIVLLTRRDMVFDHAGNYLYVGTSDGFIRRYNIAAAQFDQSYNLGGSLNGIDIAADDSFLLAAQGATGATQGTIQRVDLPSGNVTNLNFTRASGEAGAWDVAIASNNTALFTTSYAGSGWTPLRQIDLSTNTITIRSDTAGSGPSHQVRQNTMLYRSADGSRIDVTDSAVFTYNANTNTFGPAAASGGSLAAVNRNGSMIATSFSNNASLDTLAGFHYLHSFGRITGCVAFDAVTDRVYGVATSSSQIFAYDTNTYAELYRLDIGESVSSPQLFATGYLVASADGRFLALSTTSGIRLFTLPNAPYPPSPAPTFGTALDMLFDHAGQRLYIATAEGYIWPFNLSTNQFETPIYLDGYLSGMDIAPDDSYLLVAQGRYGLNEGAWHKVSLSTHAVANITYTRQSGEGGAWDVALASNGKAFGSTNYNGSGFTPIRQFDVTTGAFTVSSNSPPDTLPSSPTSIQRSADGTRLLFLEGNISSGPIFTYDATTDSFGPRVNTNAYLDGTSGAVNRNGTLLATHFYNTKVSLDTLPNFGFVHSFNPLDGRMAFDALSDTVYGTSSYLSQIISYDTNTFAERFRFDIGETISSFSGPNQLVTSPDGRYLALQTSTATRIYTVPAVPLAAVRSVRLQGGTSYSVDLPLDGPRAIESRGGGAARNYQMVFTFGNLLASVGNASVTAGTATIASQGIDPNDAHRYVVNLTNVTNRQTVKITLSNVVDTLGNRTGLISEQVGVLIGDTNGDGTVNAADAQQVRNASGQEATNANFRADVNGDGVINSGDAIIVRAASGNSLP